MHEPRSASLHDLPVAFLRESPHNPRRSMDAQSLEDLQASIAQVGITDALVVRPLAPAAGGSGVDLSADDDGAQRVQRVDGELYQVVSGHRRLAAARALGLVTVPCVVRDDLAESEAREIGIVANLQRADVHPVEEAEAYRLLISDSASHGFGSDRTAEDVACRVGKSTAYVAQRLKLLDLEIYAKELFVDGHITLDHALLLARLTPVDQERAVRMMLRAEGDFKKFEMAELLGKRKHNLANNEYARGARLIGDTAAELKRWISANVLLQLKTAPWALDDATLVEIAGACTDCPKRSGSNAALFADLTPEQDVCLDAECFGTKRKAFVAFTSKQAEAAGEPLLKLSAKSGYKVLPAEVTDKITFRAGQWVKAKKNSCTAVRKGIFVDASGAYSQEKFAAGDTITVCVAQGCKVHVHVVEDAAKASGSAGASTGASYADQEKRSKEKRASYVAAELPVRRAVVDAILAKPARGVEAMRAHLVDEADLPDAFICSALQIPFNAPAGQDNEWSLNAAARTPLGNFIAKASLEQLAAIVYLKQVGDAAAVNEYGHAKVREQRADLWTLAKAVGVDADAIAKRVEAGGVVPVAAAAEKPAKAAGPKSAAKSAAVSKKTATKKAATKKPTPTKLTAKKRADMAAALKKRWAEQRTKAAGKKDKGRA